MNRALVDRIVNAVLYEGYVLYPYRPAVKNQQRWTFGSLFPRAYCEANGGESSRMQTECIVCGDENTTLHANVRFLHLIDRVIDVVEPSGEIGGRFGRVESVRVGDCLCPSWQEAVERDAILPPLRLGNQAIQSAFTFAASSHVEPIQDSNTVARIERIQHTLTLAVHVSAQREAAGLFRITVQVENQTAIESVAISRTQALLRSLASMHAILGVEQGEFISLVDPPEEARSLAKRCTNIGVWPVLVGEPGQRDTMLASPIILYDYPQIAAESPGNLFDGTEIDEILSLRILTLSDDEKRQSANLDERVRALLTRTDSLDRKQLIGLHGTMRPLSQTPVEGQA